MGVRSHYHDDRPRMRIFHWPHTQTLDYDCRHSMAIPDDGKRLPLYIENAEPKSFSFTRVATVKKEVAERPILLFSLRQCFLWYWWMQLDRNATTSPSTFRLHRQKSARQGWVLKRRSCKWSLYKTRQTPRTLPKKRVLYKPFLFLAGFLFRFYTK